MGQEISAFANAAVQFLGNLLGIFQTQTPSPNPNLAEMELSLSPVSPDHEQQVVDEWGSRPPPKEWPTLPELRRALDRIQDPGHQFFHFGIAGVVKSGKSSIINSLRGLRAKDEGASKVGVVEVLGDVQRYEYPGRTYPFVMYDVPGSGTYTVPTATYFNSQGLFAMDAMLVVVSDSFQEHDAELISHCQALRIPAYIVRSKSDTHIQNICQDEGHDDPDANAVARAKEHYAKAGRTNIRNGLQQFDLQDEKVYLINSQSMRRLVSRLWTEWRADRFAMDEADLLKDLLEECKRRRLKVPEEEAKDNQMD